MNNPFTRLAACVASALFLSMAALVPLASSAQAAAATTVKSHVRHLKNGKTVQVKSYTRTKTGAKPKMAHVKGYNRVSKSGKVTHVKGYNRHLAPKKAKQK